MSDSTLDPDTFLARWAGADGSELANYQLFVGDLCRLLDVPLPEPAREDTRDNAYVFERRARARPRRHAEEPARRAAEEAAGHVRWLRPEFQTRALAREAAGEAANEAAGEQTSFEIEEAEPAEPATGTGKPGKGAKATAPAPGKAPATPAAKRPWPTGLAEQVKSVADVLAAAGRPLALADIEAHFGSRGRWRERLPVILETLTALGRARVAANHASSGAPSTWAAS